MDPTLASHCFSIRAEAAAPGDLLPSSSPASCVRVASQSITRRSYTSWFVDAGVRGNTKGNAIDVRQKCVNAHDAAVIDCALVQFITSTQTRCICWRTGSQDVLVLHGAARCCTGPHGAARCCTVLPGRCCGVTGELQPHWTKTGNRCKVSECVLSWRGLTGSTDNQLC